MGNAATCHVCGSDKTLRTAGSVIDLKRSADGDGAADSEDDSLVRGGASSVLLGTCLTKHIVVITLLLRACMRARGDNHT